MNDIPQRTEDDLEAEIAAAVELELRKSENAALRAASEEITTAVVAGVRESLQDMRRVQRVPRKILLKRVTDAITSLRGILLMKGKFEAYVKFMEEIGNKPLDIDDFTSPAYNTGIEFIYLQQYGIQPGDEIRIAKRKGRGRFEERPAVVERITSRCLINIRFTDEKSPKTKTNLRPSQITITKD